MTPIHISEPLGARQTILPLLIGGEGAQLVLPGVQHIALRIEEEGGQYWLRLVDAAGAQLNGVPLRSDVVLATPGRDRVGRSADRGRTSRMESLAWRCGMRRAMQRLRRWYWTSCPARRSPPACAKSLPLAMILRLRTPPRPSRAVRRGLQADAAAWHAGGDPGGRAAGLDVRFRAGVPAGDAEVRCGERARSASARGRSAVPASRATHGRGKFGRLQRRKGVV